MRKFKFGATRDTEDGKFDYESFLSPLVIERFGEYMHQHRKLKDGTMRDGDNWQKLFGENHYDVCIKSLWRHFMDLWKQHRGFKSKEDVEDSICAIIFNAQAYLHKRLKEKK